MPTARTATRLRVVGGLVDQCPAIAAGGCPEVIRPSATACPRGRRARVGNGRGNTTVPQLAQNQRATGTRVHTLSLPMQAPLCTGRACTSKPRTHMNAIRMPYVQAVHHAHARHAYRLPQASAHALRLRTTDVHMRRLAPEEACGAACTGAQPGLTCSSSGSCCCSV